jgi:Transposase zinc-binding domain
MLARADIFRRYGPASRATCADHMPPSHLQAMTAIAQCRTEALGGHGSQCMACGDLEYSEHACTHRHGPTCQNDEATRWLEQQRVLRLPVSSFLVTLTLPEALRPAARSHQSRISTLLLQTSSAALKARALDPHYRVGQIGLVGVLHTWPRALASPPSIYARVPGGAPAPDGSQWLSPPLQSGSCPSTPFPTSSGARARRR